MNQDAQILNEALEGTVALSVLSDLGKKIYFPKGIVAQGNQAKEKAKKYNATIGVAFKDGKIMSMPSIMEQFSEKLSPQDVLSYAPTLGLPALRDAWKKDLEKKNPSLKGRKYSRPFVTCGLTAGLSLLARMFINKGDVVVLPDLYWENYDLVFGENCGAKIKSFPFFKGKKFNVEGLAKTIDSVKKDKVVVALNFPNNPSGYTPLVDEMEKIAQVLKERATENKKIVVIMDDAYYSLFYDKDVERESLFAKILNASENLLAIKADAATKEEMVWGFRVGFVTYSWKGMDDKQMAALDDKFTGMTRMIVSSCPTCSQRIILNALNKVGVDEEKREGIVEIGWRWKAFKEALRKHKDCKYLIPLPFNSGYFMSFKTNEIDPEQLRMKLLDEYSTGVVALFGKYIRVAFSSVDKENIEGLVDTIYKAAGELLG